jgi:hypothetical protein
MIELIVFIIIMLIILWIVYFSAEIYGSCPDCGDKLIHWTQERLDCPSCGYKKY